MSGTFGTIPVPSRPGRSRKDINFRTRVSTTAPFGPVQHHRNVHQDANGTLVVVTARGVRFTVNAGLWRLA